MMNSLLVNKTFNSWKIPIVRQFVFYTAVGGIATIVDWGSFYVGNSLFNIDHKVAVVISFTLGATTNYLLNKILTFQDKTRQLATQIGVYVVISLISLLLSVFFMYVLVDMGGMRPMLGRMLTTLIMLFANFLMHKFITFNRTLYDKVFQSAGE